MTPEELFTLDNAVEKFKALELKRLGELVDKEDIHITCDGYLMVALRQLGRGDIVDAYNEVVHSCGGFWYA